MFGLPKNINARFTVSVLTYKYDLDVTISVADVLNLLSKNRDALTTIETQMLQQLGQSTDMQKFVNALLTSSLGFNVPAVTILPGTNPPSETPSDEPTVDPSYVPTMIPSHVPSVSPSHIPTMIPSFLPTNEPSVVPSLVPTKVPTIEPSYVPTVIPTKVPTIEPSYVPTIIPSLVPTNVPSFRPYSNGPSPLQSQYPIMSNTTQSALPTVGSTLRYEVLSTPESNTTIICSSGNIVLFIVAGLVMGVMLSQLYTVVRRVYSVQHQTKPDV